MKNNPSSPLPNNAATPSLELWSVAKVAAFLRPSGIPASPPTIYRKVASGNFPQPLRFGRRCTRWRADCVRSWLTAQVASPSTSK